MKLIGMLDSPFVRRCAVSFDLLDIAFEHQPLSVFNDFEEFSKINPVVKAPTLVCDDGTCIIDSNLIIQYAEQTLSGNRSLLTAGAQLSHHAVSIVGLALVACEKTAQIAYEKNLRPQEKQHGPWLDRLQFQLRAAYDDLEKIYLARKDEGELSMTQDNITVAIAWTFTQSMLADVILTTDYPTLSEVSATLEASDCFKRYPPLGNGVKLD